jgi:hypothetical protein
MGKKSRSGSGMFIPDHISKSLETIFLVKNNSLMRNLFEPGSRMEKFVFGINIQDPPH